MIRQPYPGQHVQIWYKKALADWFPLHGKTGIVRVRWRGRGPQNVGVEIDGELYVVPTGNLRPFVEPTEADSERLGEQGVFAKGVELG